MEQQIKKQIEEREINPSRDLWAEIESQTSTQSSGKTKINWFLMAACLLLMATLSVVLILNKEKVIEPEIANTEILPQKNKLENRTKKEGLPVLAQKTEIIASKNISVQPSPKVENSKQEVVAKVETLTKKNQQIVSEIYKTPISNQNILATIDSTNVPKKRKKYVDASTLLFSVEHKDVIENSKDGSNVATIDLNSK